MLNAQATKITYDVKYSCTERTQYCIIFIKRVFGLLQLRILIFNILIYHLKLVTEFELISMGGIAGRYPPYSRGDVYPKI